MKHLIAALAVLVLSGCTAVQVVKERLDDTKTRIYQFTVNDAAQAYKLAEAAGDTQGMFCWSVVQSELNRALHNKPDGTEALAVLIQKLRNESRGAGPLGRIKEACEPVFKSVPDAALQAAIKLGIQAAPVPVPGR